MRFKVFHNDEGSAAGSYFRFFTCMPDAVDFVEEYAVVQKNETSLRVSYYQQGKPFEFCGAGALCLAFVYGPNNGAVTVESGGQHYSLSCQEGAPVVSLQIISATQIEGNNYYFSQQQTVISLLPTEADVVAYDIDAHNNALKHVPTVIAVYIDNDQKRIVFRYFTSFNNKGEDQATGSVFRYLGSLPILEDCRYDVCQRSVTGAVMQCFKNNDYLNYTGKVTPL